MRHVTSIHLLMSVTALCSFGCMDSNIIPIGEQVQEPEPVPEPEETPVYRPESTHSLNPSCDNALLISETFDIFFDEQNPSCKWGVNDNISAQDGYLTARVRESAPIPVDLSREICGITFDFDPNQTGQSLSYDDELFLLFNDVVLLSSDKKQVERLREKDGLRLFNWEELVGAPIDFSPSVPHYCLGEDEGMSACEVPDAHVTGEVRLDLEPELMKILGEYAVDIGEATFDMVTIGDNDPENDCFHSPFSLSITIHSIWGA